MAAKASESVYTPMQLINHHVAGLSMQIINVLCDDRIKQPQPLQISEREMPGIRQRLFKRPVKLLHYVGGLVLIR